MATDDAPNLRRLARQLVDVTRRLKHLETVPQLAHSSLDDHGMPVYDADGNLTVTIGKQADGTWGAPPVKGPVPPQPAGVEAEGDAGVIRASWQGVFWAGAAKPMDFEAVEVLVDGTVYAGIHDPQGGSVSVPALSGVRAVSFRTLSQAGVVSASMGHVQVTVEPRVSEQMQELHENLDELNDVTLPELRDDLAGSAGDLQGKLDNLNARVDDLVVDGGGSGNFTTYSINEPSGVGTGEGDQWFRVVNGEVLGQWRWDGSAWQAVTLTDAIIAGIDLSKLVSNGNLSEIVANKMFADLFAANKITSQEIAAGSITTEKIAAEGIVADVIQGGSFVGETFEGGSFTGGLFKTSDALPGQVELADNGYITHFGGGGEFPGLRITPINTSDMEYPAGIGPSTDGLTVYGGQSKSGASSIVQANPGGSFLRTFRPNGVRGGEIQTTAGTSYMRTYREDGGTGGTLETSPTWTMARTYSGNGNESGWVRVDPDTAELASVDSNNYYASRIRAEQDFARITSTNANGDVGSVYASGSQVNLASTAADGSEGVALAMPDYVHLASFGPDSSLLARLSADGRTARMQAAGGHRYLELNETGIWIGVGSKSYNLEETAQDSGWQSFPIASGVTASGVAWRNKNGIAFFKGSITATWNRGWNAISLNIGANPAFETRAWALGGQDASNWTLRVRPSGDLYVYAPEAGNQEFTINSLFYPIG